VRFIDSNVFIYAVIRPRRQLTESEKQIKSSARKIIERVDKGEKVLTTVVHLSEVANILEDLAGLEFSISFTRDVLLKPNIIIKPVSPEDYITSIAYAENLKISGNDALAYLTMKRNGINEIYTFDKHFEKINVNIIKE